MNNNQRIVNILVVGVGGQGVMTASEVLCETAISQGYDAKKTEMAGMAQRGGVVSSHVRFGPKVLSPEIACGEADILVAFEAAEAMRWCHYLRPDGVAMVNRLHLEPPIVTLGLFPYPPHPVDEIRKQGIRVHDFDGSAIALELGDKRLVNTVMMGAISEDLPFAPEMLKQHIVERFRIRKPALAELNAQAFDRGRAATR
ncbi:MAG: indolepyruvate oxidoreductase subunit beta [Burkholderiales bacterium]|jgi:indolepyruvate ferredoxin oxidoreductase beta subunit|nr:indolepyruvate oxidoreductase subunit beta [Burkholderiales bacterium]